MENTNNWYYAVKGERVGPINLQEIQGLVDEGKINP
jgi:hypothetical protein